VKNSTKKQSLLWRITPAFGGIPSYLFGTMHVRDQRAFGWLDLAKKHLESCDYFATEFDFLETDPVALAVALTLPNDSSLKDYLPRGAWKQLDYYAQNILGVSAEDLQYQHPMSVSTLLSTAFMAEEMAHSLDETLWQHARSSGKTTTGVESFADQLETLHRIPFELHITGLTWLLNNLPRQKVRLKKMIQWYAAGEIQALYKAAKKDAKGMRKILLYRRNRAMAQRFADLANQHSLFCAVGAGHLAGGKGMLRLLKQVGFKIEPILLLPPDLQNQPST
jgi:uncharacterized protein YbaP (TraB family)